MSPGGRNPLPRAKWPDLIARALGAVAHREARGDAADRDWARSILTPAEFDLWSRLSDHDRRHTIQVARRVELRLASTAYAGDTLWPAAALMHDVGKGEADLNAAARCRDGRDPDDDGRAGPSLAGLAGENEAASRALSPPRRGRG